MKILNIGNLMVNSCLIDTGRGYILVDTGYPGGYTRFCKKIKSIGINIDEIKYIFITHVHYDHVGFLSELMRATQAKIILHNRAVEKLKAGKSIFGKEFYTFKRAKRLFSLVNLVSDNSSFEPIDEPDRYVEVVNAIEQIEVLGVRLSILTLPGHTEDSIGLMLEDGSLFCGDAAMNGFPSKNRYSILVEDLTNYEESWNVMLKSKPKIIYPGHGKPFYPLDLSKFKNTHNGKLYPM